MTDRRLAVLIAIGLAAVPAAHAVVYCTGPGVPVGCVVRPAGTAAAAAAIATPGVGAPGVGVRDPGINQPGAAGNVGVGGSVVNQNGGVNRVGPRR